MARKVFGVVISHSTSTSIGDGFVHGMDDGSAVVAVVALKGEPEDYAAYCEDRYEDEAGEWHACRLTGTCDSLEEALADIAHDFGDAHGNLRPATASAFLPHGIEGTVVKAFGVWASEF